MLVDAHAHLGRYEAELDDAAAEIDRRRIFTISVSMSVPSYLRNLDIARRSDRILPVFGVHPWTPSGYVDHVVACIAGLKGMAAREVTEAVYANLRRLIGNDPNLHEPYCGLLNEW